MEKKVKVLVLTGDGINCEKEIQWVFRKAGATADISYIEDLVQKEISLRDYHIMAIPGGFSFGDHLGSGKIFANKIYSHLKKELFEFIQSKKLIIGICNGFQIMTKLGLLPNTQLGEQQVSLSHNESFCYENRWVHLKVNPLSSSIWLKGIDQLYIPVRHGEGRLVVPKNITKEIHQSHLDCLHYTDARGNITDQYPLNPNGSYESIAGLCDKSGLMLGLMPHPEGFRILENAPGWKHSEWITENVKKLIQKEDGAGMSVFYNGVRYAQENLL